MDYGTTLIKNPTAAHAPAIDAKAAEWGNVEADILGYLSDVSKLEAFANAAQDAEQIASYIEPFLQNARTYFESMQQVTEGQVEWTELRKKFGSTVAKSIAKIRKLNAEFGSEMETIDAQDRANLLKIEQKRKHAIAEVAAELNHALQMEIFRHQNKISGIELRNKANQQRQTLQQSLREKRQELMQRARYGNRLNASPTEQIPVSIHQSNGTQRSGISASGQPGFWSRLWQGLGNR
ncbi:MAG: hypothetical protein KME15_26955 [Drouetiella hepatica Uher 2000/2452]|jgi:hypothetical protein|uniref:Uncharacterized protein n=1 Tax=Drouetiella hepatica Uher 2000/2452 TaxID=904376 RepID=A0A951QGR8_9CYAN|nr:hypothetical protein [Drouetiella hepatica Uher 2000/2452]